MNTPNVPVSPPQAARILLKDLQQKFPTFQECKPLAIGIDKQLIAAIPELNRKILRIALGIHTNSLQYLKGMEKATVRFNLAGEEADQITDAHRAHATEILRERSKKNAELKKAQREAEFESRKRDEALRKAEEATRERAEKLNQLAAKFSRKG